MRRGRSFGSGLLGGEGVDSPGGKRRARGGGGGSVACALAVAFCIVQLALVYRGHAGLLKALGASTTADGLKHSAAFGGGEQVKALARLADRFGERGADVALDGEGVVAASAPLQLATLHDAFPGEPPPPSPASPPPQLPVVNASAWHVAPPPPPWPPGTSVLVATMSAHFFSDFERVVPDCDVACEFKDSAAAGEADALWYHAPSSCGSDPSRQKAGQLTVVMSMESSLNYPCLDDAAWMALFDIEMTYRLRSAIPLTYLRPSHIQDFGRPLVPFAAKKNAVVYIQSNCGAQSGRDDILNAAMALGVAVEARGACLNNAPLVDRNVGKGEAMKEYLFCATMENSVVVDYVSEKVWDGLAAGCLPIYYGAPNIVDHLPTPDSVIDYVALGGTPQALAAELARLAGDELAYAQRMAWRRVPLARLGEGYQRLVAEATDKEHSQCRLCKLVAAIRREGKARPWTAPASLPPAVLLLEEAQPDGDVSDEAEERVEVEEDGPP